MPADDQGHRRDGREPKGQDARGRLTAGLYVGQVAYREVVLLVRRGPMTLAQQSADVLGGLGKTLRLVHLDHHVLDRTEAGLRRAQDPDPRRGERDHDLVVLIGARRALTLGLEHAHHLERGSADANQLADRVPVGKQAFDDCLAEDRDLGRAGLLGRGNGPARGQRPLAGREVVVRDPLDRRRPVGVASDHLSPPEDRGRRAQDAGNLPGNGARVLDRQVLAAPAAKVHALSADTAGRHQQQVAPEALDLGDDPDTRPFADGHNGDHRGDADHDPEHRQRIPERVDAQRLGRAGKAHSQAHPTRSTSLSRTCRFNSPLPQGLLAS